MDEWLDTGWHRSSAGSRGIRTWPLAIQFGYRRRNTYEILGNILVLDCSLSECLDPPLRGYTHSSIERRVRRQCQGWRAPPPSLWCVPWKWIICELCSSVWHFRLSCLSDRPVMAWRTLLTLGTICLYCWLTYWHGHSLKLLLPVCYNGYWQTYGQAIRTCI